MGLEQCRKIDLPKIFDPRGNLTFIEGNNHIPFDIKRVFYLYDVPGGEMRAGHSNTQSQQFIIAMSGSFSVMDPKKRLFILIGHIMVSTFRRWFGVRSITSHLGRCVWC